MDTKSILSNGEPEKDIESKQVAKQNNDLRYTLNVSNLSYRPRRHLVRQGLLWFRRQVTEMNIGWLLPSLRTIKPHEDSVLHRINFSCRGGELTTVLGDEEETRKLMHLIAGRTRTGHFDGEILLSGAGISNKTYYHDQVAFVPSKPLYIPGLTYLEMLTFSVQLKIMPVPGQSTSLLVEERIQQLLTLMDLTKCKNRIIPHYPTLRGEEGGDIRRLSICLEIARMPPVIVIHEPTLHLGPAFATNIMQCLKTVADRGHVVICAMSKVYPTEVELIDRIVMVSEGYSIYSNSPRKAQPFFCNPPMGYEFKKGTELMDFLMDVASGVERPVKQREADLPVIMQEKYEMSDYFEHIPAGQESCSCFSEEFFHFYGYSKFDPPLYALYRITTTVKRAIYTKFRDTENIKASLFVIFFISLVCGYLQFDQGSYGHYALSLVGFPYANTANIAGLLFFISAFAWATPFLSVHIVCQKLQLYRYELNSRCTTTFAFVLGTLLSEVPFSIFYIALFSNLIYFMSDMGKGYAHYWFFVELLCLEGLVGVAGAYLYAAIFRKELLVRDLFILTVSVIALISGFPFQLLTMNSLFTDASVVNPWRWAFEALMSYKFNQYVDGEKWLAPYSFAQFDHGFGRNIMGNFIWITCLVCLLFLFKEPILLERVKSEGKTYGASASRDSTNSVDDLPDSSDVERKSTRQSELVKPLVFMRESSVTGRASKLSVNVSQMGDENMDRGPTVLFKDLSLRVPDSSPLGFKQILQRVSGKFDWGKLSMIMGATKSGKSSLLHVLAGDIAVGAQVSGRILFDGKEAPADQKLWQRCGFVPAENDHYRDLTVKEVLEFGMKLRCLNRSGLQHIEENVNRTVEILHLGDCLNKKTKKCTPGELKRVSIAEEMVAGPKLLLMDEPTTGVNIYEIVVLLQTFREMVNQDRTVVASIHQPTPEEFKLFDSLLLLSKGRVIYQGPVHNATNFFISSPFAFDYRNYTNPADFVTDISGGFLSDSKGEFIDSSVLENHYMQSEGYLKLQQQIRAKLPKQAAYNNSSLSDIDNPLAKYGGGRGVPTQAKADLDRGSLTSDSGNQNNGHSIEIENGGDPYLRESTLSALQKKPKPVFLQVLQEAVSETYQPHIFFMCKYFSRYVYYSATGNSTLAQQQLQYFSDLWNLVSGLTFKGGILFHRTCLALYRRHELVVSSQAVHIFLALMFGWIMGDSSGSAGLYNTNSFFAVSSMFLMIANVVFVFYMFNSSQVFLKEYCRGLYGNFLRWITNDYPLYVLRMVNTVTFVSIVWGMTNQSLDPKTFGFAILSYMMLVLASLMLAETIIVASEDKRGCYTGIPGSAFLNFLFSGLFLKAQSLPRWMAPWAPSVSMIRWNFQGNFINVYHGSDVFVTLPTGYSTYTAFLRLFGWGGKTKWYCFYMVCINVVVFKFISLWAGAICAVKRRGGKRSRDVDE